MNSAIDMFVWLPMFSTLWLTDCTPLLCSFSCDGVSAFDRCSRRVSKSTVLCSTLRFLRR